jgi:hypothetical protein
MLLLFMVALFGWNAWQRWDDATVRLYIANRTDAAALVRVTDGTSGRGLGTVRLGAATRTLVADHRLDVWSRELGVPEQAAGFERGIRLELLGSGCEALETLVVGRSWPETLTLLPDDGLVDFTTDEPLADLPLRQGAEVAAADPCQGRPAPPVAVVENLRVAPIVLNGRVRVEACSARTLHPGDAAQLLSRKQTKGARAVDVPSLALQKARWPLESRTVTVALEIDDYHAAAVVDPTVFDGCRKALGLAKNP